MASCLSASCSRGAPPMGGDSRSSNIGLASEYSESEEKSATVFVVRFPAATLLWEAFLAASWGLTVDEGEVNFSALLWEAFFAASWGLTVDEGEVNFSGASTSMSCGNTTSALV